MCYYYKFKKEASTSNKSLSFLSHDSPVFWGLTGSIARKDLQNSFISLFQCRSHGADPLPPSSMCSQDR